MRAKNAELVARIRAKGIRDERLLAAFSRIDRADFVPEDERENAYNDSPIRLPESQVTSQPSLIAGMIVSLELTGNEKVLEIGTGFGYQTALLAVLAREVHSIEWFPALSASAGKNLAKQKLRQVNLVVGDGTRGLPEAAPFDAILCSAAAPLVPPPLVEQLREGGKIVIPIGIGGAEDVIVFRKSGTHVLKQHDIAPASFVPLRGAWGAPARIKRIL